MAISRLQRWQGVLEMIGGGQGFEEGRSVGRMG